MIGALALLAAAALVWASAPRAGVGLRVEERLGLTCAVAPPLVGWAVYVPSLAVGLVPSSVALVGVALGGAALALGGCGAASRREATELLLRSVRGTGRARSRAALGALACCLALCAPIFAEAWFEGPGGALYTGTANNLGDVVLHVGIAHAFAFGENIPPENVIWAGRPLVYPFLPDFTTATLIAGGWSTGAATWVPALAAVTGLLILLGALARRASGRPAAALLPGPLLLLSGGAQFALWLFGPGWPDAAALEARRIVWKNPLLSLLVTQRATLFGLALIASVALLVWRALDADGEGRPGSVRRGLAAAGVLCGGLPLVFPHGFMALAAVLPLIAALYIPRRWPAWGLLGAIAAAASLPQLVWLLQGDATGAIRWLPGWMAAPEGESATPLGLVRFWLWNLGALVPLALVALLARRRVGLARPGFWWAWWIWFALPCFVAFAPWPWDNTKLLVVWLAMTLVPVSALLSRLLAGGWAARAAGLVAALSLTLSGARDVGHALFAERDYLEYDGAAHEAALRLRSASPPDAVILERPHWAQLALLAGRRAFIGYPGHLWSHGIDYAERETEVGAFYRSLSPGAGGSDAERRRFLERSEIDFVVLGPGEIGHYGSDPARLRSLLERVFRVGPYSVFAVGPAARPGGRASLVPVLGEEVDTGLRPEQLLGDVDDLARVVAHVLDRVVEGGQAGDLVALDAAGPRQLVLVEPGGDLATALDDGRQAAEQVARRAAAPGFELQAPAPAVRHAAQAGENPLGQVPLHVEDQVPDAVGTRVRSPPELCLVQQRDRGPDPLQVTPEQHR